MNIFCKSSFQIGMDMNAWIQKQGRDLKMQDNYNKTAWIYSIMQGSLLVFFNLCLLSIPFRSIPFGNEVLQKLWLVYICSFGRWGSKPCGFQIEEKWNYCAGNRHFSAENQSVKTHVQASVTSTHIQLLVFLCFRQKAVQAVGTS